MTWDDDHILNTESTRQPARPTLPHYIPPHLRHRKTTTTPSPPFRYSTDSTHYTRPPLCQPPSNSSYHPRGGRARGRGRGRGSGRSQWRSAPRGSSLNHPLQNQNQNPFDIAERFDELEVLEEDDDTNDNTAINFDAYEDIPVETSGSNIPPPVNSFADIDMGRVLNENIKRCKYVKPTPVQKHAIPIAFAGRDLMACAQTGSGKTAAFCFPIISGILRSPFKTVGSGRGGTRMAYPSALILSPTRELSCQIQEEVKKFAYDTGVKIVVAYGGAPIVHQFRNLEKGVDILVATPGRLLDMIERGKVSLRTIRYLALDEADRMLDMGFEPQIRKIVQETGMPPPGERQTLLFSATFPHEIQGLASDFLSNYIFLAVGRVGSSTDLIIQKVELVQDMDKRSHLMDLLHAQKSNGTRGKHALTLIFVETKRGADALEHWLSMNGFPATAIHGDKVQMERERALKSFKSGATPILVATDVASRGLDIPHVSHVINFDLPTDIDSYVHRIGRTGRAGKSGRATAFFSDKNMPIAKALVELMKEANQEVPPWLSQYAESSSYGDTGRAKRYGGSKFGGYDFRSDSQFGTENYYHSSAHDTADSLVHSYASPSAFGYAVPTSADYYAAASTGSYVVASHGYGFGHESGHESAVASGWI